jgi:hypothetical protein
MTVPSREEAARLSCSPGLRPRPLRRSGVVAEAGGGRGGRIFASPRWQEGHARQAEAVELPHPPELAFGAATALRRWSELRATRPPDAIPRTEPA